MLKNKPKYRTYIVYLFLLSYLLSTFQSPLQEIAHFFAHLPTIVSSDYSYHSYHSDHHHHHHQALDLFDDHHQSDHDKDTSVKEIKKKAEINTPLYLPFVDINARIDNFNDIFFVHTRFDVCTVPPPEIA